MTGTISTRAGEGQRGPGGARSFLEGDGAQAIPHPDESIVEGGEPVCAITPGEARFLSRLRERQPGAFERLERSVPEHIRALPRDEPVLAAAKVGAASPVASSVDVVPVGTATRDAEHSATNPDATTHQQARPHKRRGAAEHDLAAAADWSKREVERAAQHGLQFVDKPVSYDPEPEPPGELPPEPKRPDEDDRQALSAPPSAIKQLRLARASWAKKQPRTDQELLESKTPTAVFVIIRRIASGAFSVGACLKFLSESGADVEDVERQCLMVRNDGSAVDDWSDHRPRRKLAMTILNALSPQLRRTRDVCGGKFAADEQCYCTLALSQNWLRKFLRPFGRAEGWSVRTLQRDLRELKDFGKALIPWRTPADEAEPFELGPTGGYTINRYVLRLRRGLANKQRVVRRKGKDARTAMELAAQCFDVVASGIQRRAWLSPPPVRRRRWLPIAVEPT